MLLTHEAVKTAARDWKTFSSDAPFRVPIPSEEDVRSMRQLPIETDPPDHGDYRRIAEPFFNRPKDPSMVAAVEKLIGDMVAGALESPSIEVVRDFALPLQSRALALLLNVPMQESEEWITWGTHVFRDGGEAGKKGARLENYIHRRLEQARNQPGEDFFTALTRARFRGRPLTVDEQAGFVNLAFAGGRDTVIQTVAGIVSHLASCPAVLESIRQNPALIMSATEEFFRVLSPLTHIGRVCPRETTVGDVRVAPGGRVSLAWASANRDPRVFDSPEELRLDRKPNQHLAFGSGAHVCLGALHARLLVRTLLKELTRRVERITSISNEPHWEKEAGYTRQNGYMSLVVRFEPRIPVPGDGNT